MKDIFSTLFINVIMTTEEVSNMFTEKAGEPTNSECSMRGGEFNQGEIHKPNNKR